MLEKVKLALRIVTNDFNEELSGMIAAALKDLEIAGVKTENVPPLIERAVICYCKIHFGDPAPDLADKWKALYNEQKAQLQMADGFTDWGDSDGSQ